MTEPTTEEREHYHREHEEWRTRRRANLLANAPVLTTAQCDSLGMVRVAGEIDVLRIRMFVGGTERVGRFLLRDNTGAIEVKLGDGMLNEHDTRIHNGRRVVVVGRLHFPMGLDAEGPPGEPILMAEHVGYL